MCIVALDGGTTTTKAWIVSQGSVLAEHRAAGGARDVAAGRTREWLAQHVFAVAQAALDRARGTWSEVEAVVAFGMITSEMGLEEVPHLVAPTGPAELADGLRPCGASTPLPTPLYLVPGVVNQPGDLAHSDFMRGEETQVAGLLASGRFEPPLLYVSAGSHGKFICVGTDGTIQWSYTTLSGELVWALANETILAAVLDPALPLSDERAADRGSSLESEAGLGRALYASRLLSRLEGADVASCTDFVRGAVAATDLRGLRQLEGLPSTVVLGAGSELGAFYERLLQREPWVRSCTWTDLPLGALGAWELWATARAATRS
jgi:2-dehydro-3-deoxygalactonokinase